MQNKNEYLTHDLGARSDPKLIKVLMRMGLSGIGLFWCLIEMLWENGGYLPCEYDVIAYELHCETEEIKRIITEFDLFKTDVNRFWNESALSRIKHKIEVSRVKAEAGQKGGKAAAIQRKGILDSNTKSLAYANKTDSVCIANDADGHSKSLNSVMAGVAKEVGISNSAALPINKSINKEIKSTIYIGEKERQRLFFIFFFKNSINPEEEVQRFLDHYDSRGWVHSDGTPVINYESTAKTWKPSKPEQSRFPVEFIKWYPVVYASAGDNPEMQKRLLSDVSSVSVSGSFMKIIYKKPDSGLFAQKLIGDNKLDEQLGYTVECTLNT